VAFGRWPSRLHWLLLSLALLGAHRAPATVYDLDRVGAPLPAITLTLLDGTPFPLARLRGRPAYVVLFASWCEPCVAELPWLKAAYAAYGDRISFLGVDVLEDRATAAALAARVALPFPVASIDEAAMDALISLDARQDGGAKYRIPADFAIDASGIVRGAWHGLPVDSAGNTIDAIPQHLAGLLAKSAPRDASKGARP